MKVGRIDVEPVLDGHILSELPGTKPFPEPSTQAWRDQHGMFRPDGRIESTTGAVLVRVDDRVVLVDAGSGQAIPGGYQPLSLAVDDPDDPIVNGFRARGMADDQIRRMGDHFAKTDLTQGELPASLATAGVRPEDVTDVLCTHLHFDHIGWTSVDGAPYFPNATIRCASADLEHFLAEPDEEQFTSLVYRAPRASQRLAPVLDRIETWEGDANLFPGVDVRLAAGHTPGSSVVVLSDGDARAMLLGDLIHCPLELMDDDFDLLVDYDQAAAIRVRQAYARELEGADVAVSASHFPGLRFGRLLPGAGVRRWVFDAD